MKQRESARVLITACGKSLMPAIKYTFEELAVRLGVPIRLCEDSKQGPFHMVYGQRVEGIDAPLIPFDARCYRREGQFAPFANPALWAHEHARKLEEIDLIGGVFRLLTLLDECQVAESCRNMRGIFAVSALPKSRRAVLAMPLVEHHVAALKSIMQKARPLPYPLPSWPEDRTWAVLLTHDTDALNLAALPELLFNCAKAVLRRDAARCRMVLDGLRFLRQPIENNPLFGFSGWKKVGVAHAVRSAFYLSVRRKVLPTFNDCRSSVADARFDWKILREMADAGWEFGLHPPIRAKDDIDEFLLGKRFLEERLERPIFGLRHHYWAMDWRKPHLTYRKHVDAGFQYDLSIAWRDAAGFRAGTCMPFRPWDPGRQRGLDIYSVPTAVMDGHVISETNGIAVASERAIAIIDDVRKNGGVATLDWHAESAVNDYCYAGHRSVMESILSHIVKAEDVWVTTPWSLVTHWHKRRKTLLEDGDS